MLRLVLAVLALAGPLASSPAAAQGCGSANPNCVVPTRPPGDSSNAAASTAFVQSAIGGLIPLPNGKLLIGSASGFAVAHALSGDCTVTNAGVMTCTKTGGVLFAPSATTDTTNASNITSGTLLSALIANGSLANAKLANMAPGTVKCQPAGGTSGAPIDCSQPVINVTDPPYNATGNGATDDTAAIQNAINALPATGGEVIFPQPSVCYKTTSALQIGNGNSTPTASTVQGVILRGIGNPTITTIGSFPQSTGPRICGPGSNNVAILVSGPLQGWGVQNLELDCGSGSTNVTGISVVAGVYGDSRDLTFINCTTGISTSSYPNFGSLHNSWRNVFILVPTVNFSIGVFADGDGVGATSNTSFDHYENLTIFLPSTLTTFGIDLKAVDSMQFFNTHIAGGSASATGLTFDYSGTGVSGQWPASVMFYGLEPSEIGTSVAISGTPGLGARPNIIYGFEETNGAVVPNITNLSVYGSHKIVSAPGGNNANTVIDFSTAGAPAISNTNGNLLSFGATGLPTLGASGNAAGWTATGGGSTPSLGTSTLPSGAAATVHEWLTMTDSAGNKVYVPAWH